MVQKFPLEHTATILGHSYTIMCCMLLSKLHYNLQKGENKNISLLHIQS